MSPTGSIRALAITGESRWPSVPDVPRVSELGGVFADYDVTAWYGLLAPARTPTAIVDKLNGIVAEALKDKTLRDELFAKGVEPIGSYAQAVPGLHRRRVPALGRRGAASGHQV